MLHMGQVRVQVKDLDMEALRRKEITTMRSGMLMGARICGQFQGRWRLQRSPFGFWIVS